MGGTFALEQFRFGDIRWLWLVFVVPVLAALYAYAFYRKSRTLKAFASASTLKFISSSVSRNRQMVKAGLILLSIVFLVLTLMRPWGDPRRETLRKKGRDVVFLLDVSRSMLARDLRPNRLERAKIAIQDVLRIMQGDRVGLVIFGGNNALKCPLTHSYDFFLTVLEKVSPSDVSRGGTNIGDARQQKQQGQDVSGAVGDLKKTQDENKKTTRELAEELQKKIDAGSATPGGGQLSPAVGQDVLAAENSLKEAEIEQGTAIQHLDREGLAEAENSEKLALQDLQSALDKLTKSQQPQPQAGGETEQKQQPRESQPEQKQQQPGKEGETKDRERKEITSQEAQEELAKLRNQTSEMRKKELENFLRRHPEYRDRRIKHEPVDKDW